MVADTQNLTTEEVDKLVRYVDGELELAEVEQVESWLETRKEVRDFVHGHGWNGDGVRLGIDALFNGNENDNGVDFSGFWSGIESRLAANSVEVTNIAVKNACTEDVSLEDSSAKELLVEVESSDLHLATPIQAASTPSSSLELLQNQANRSPDYLQFPPTIGDTANASFSEAVQTATDPANQKSQQNLLRDVVLYRDSELTDPDRLIYFKNLFASNRDTLTGEERTAYDLYYSLQEVKQCIVSANDEMLHNVSFDILIKKVRDSIAEKTDTLSSITNTADRISFSSGSQPKPANDNLLRRYKQGIIGALAAILVIGFSSLVYYAAYGKNQTIIHKTVVVVEDVQYGPGFSGEVVNPVQQVSSPKGKIVKAENEEDPTIIWVYDKPKNKKNIEGRAKKQDTRGDVIKNKDEVDAPSKSGGQNVGKKIRGISI